MNTLTRIGWYLLRGLGVEEGESREYYRTVVDVVAFGPAALIVILSVASGRYHWLTWLAVMVMVFIIVFASRRWLVVSSIFAIVGVRAVITGVVTSQRIWLAIAVACAVIVYGLVRMDERQTGGYR